MFAAPQPLGAYAAPPMANGAPTVNFSTPDPMMNMMMMRAAPGAESGMIPTELTGVVSKALLLYFPVAAGPMPGGAAKPAIAALDPNASALAALRSELLDHGFVIVREDKRRMTREQLSDIVALDFDANTSAAGKNGSTHAPPPSGSADATARVEGIASTLLALSCGDAPPSPPPALQADGAFPAVSSASIHVFVLARSDCHAHLQQLLRNPLRGGAAPVPPFGAAAAAPMYSPALGQPGYSAPTPFPQEQAAAAGIIRAPLFPCQPSLPALAPLASQAVSYPMNRVFVNSAASTSTRAVQLLYPSMLVHDIPSDAVANEYVDTMLRTALVTALTDLAKEKPKDPLRWLAESLLNNDTNTAHPVTHS